MVGCVRQPGTRCPALRQTGPARPVSSTPRGRPRRRNAADARAPAGRSPFFPLGREAALAPARRRRRRPAARRDRSCPGRPGRMTGLPRLWFQCGSRSTTGLVLRPARDGGDGWPAGAISISPRIGSLFAAHTGRCKMALRLSDGSELSAAAGRRGRRVGGDGEQPPKEADRRLARPRVTQRGRNRDYRIAGPGGRAYRGAGAGRLGAAACSLGQSTRARQWRQAWGPATTTLPAGLGSPSWTDARPRLPRPPAAQGPRDTG